MVAFLAVFTSIVWADTQKIRGRGKLVVRVVILAMDVVFLAAAIADYGDAVWFPSD